MADEKRLIDANKIKFTEYRGGGGRDYPENVVTEYEIAKMPTVDAVEVVHGRWINWGKSGTPTYENYGTCSVCHEDAEICTEHRNYCPNCGAKMDLEVSDGKA